jgi:hypothetical protein
VACTVKIVQATQKHTQNHTHNHERSIMPKPTLDLETLLVVQKLVTNVARAAKRREAAVGKYGSHRQADMEFGKVISAEDIGVKIAVLIAKAEKSAQ